MKASVESVADLVVQRARPGGVVLVDSEFFGPLVEVLRTRAGRLNICVRTVHFADPVNVLKQALMMPKPEIACCPEASSDEECECLRKAQMLLGQMGIPVLETHTEPSVVISDRFKTKPAEPLVAA